VIDNDILKGSILGNKAQLYGDLAVDYVSVLGIRSDEQRRITKIENRIDEAQENQGKSLFNQPHGESIYAPLVNDNTTQEQVAEFWEQQNFNLKLSNTGLFSKLHGITLSNFNNSGSIFSPLSTLFLISSKTNLLIPPKKPTNLVLSLAICLRSFTFKGG
jgi:hypothetical protein